MLKHSNRGGVQDDHISSNSTREDNKEKIKDKQHQMRGA